MFEVIYPFIDGNGRAGRLLFIKILKDCGEDPRIFFFKDRESYYLEIQCFRENYWTGYNFDMDAICQSDPNDFIKDSQLVISSENETHLCNWTFAAPPLSPLLKCVIDESVNKILNIFSFTSLGEHFIHETTGPGIFTIGIEKYLKSLDLVTYKNKKAYESYKDKILYVFPYFKFHNEMIIKPI